MTLSNAVVLVLLLSATVVAVRVVASARRRRRPGWTVVVRCLAGHVFTTEWASSGSLRGAGLSPIRPRYCPVGEHWTMVSPLRPEDLTLGEWQMARRYHD